LATHKPVIINELFGELKIPPEPQRWTVVHTRPRREKKLADYAAKNLIQYYLPQIKHKRIYQRRKVVTTVPMFPGYMFMILSVTEQQTIAISGMAAHFIHVRHQQELLDDLSRICFSNKKDVALEPAMWLSKGLGGVVESHDKISEVRLQVNILRQAVMVKTEPGNVKIIGEYEIVEDEQ